MNRDTQLRLHLLNFLYPNLCDCCGVRIPYDALLCASCQTALKTLEIESTAWRSNCDANVIPPWDGMTTVYVYKDAAQQGILSLKQGYTGFLSFVTEQLTERLLAETAGHPLDCVTFVPMWMPRRYVQGYNHSERIARALAKRMQLPLRSDLLTVHRGGLRQHQLNRAARQMYAKRFTHTGVPLKGQQILLCDDILTTGNTLMRCTEQLLECGAASVWVAVCACRI